MELMTKIDSKQERFENPRKVSRLGCSFAFGIWVTRNP